MRMVHAAQIILLGFARDGGRCESFNVAINTAAHGLGRAPLFIDGVGRNWYFHRRERKGPGPARRGTDITSGRLSSNLTFIIFNPARPPCPGRLSSGI